MSSEPIVHGHTEHSGHVVAAYVKKISCVSRFSPAPTVSPEVYVGPYSVP